MGIITLYFFVSYLFPLFWPLIWVGPYREFRLISNNDKIKLNKGKVDIERPFIINHGTEEYMVLSYRPTLKIWNLLVESAKVTYRIRLPKISKYKLPRPNEFVWGTQDFLRIKINNKWKEFKINLGTGTVSIKF